MSRYRRWRIAGGTYFFTVNLLDRRATLLIDHIDCLRRAFRMALTRRPFHIDAIVVLPDHLHCIWTLPRGDADFSARWAAIKREFSRAMPLGDRRSNSRVRHGERSIWQRRFWEHAITEQDDYIAHVNYIHCNPVKHGLCRRAVDWPHSSIHRYIERGTLTAEWGTDAPPRDLELE